MSPSRPKRRAKRSAVRKFGPAAGAAVATLVIGGIATQLPADNQGGTSVEASQSQADGTTDDLTSIPPTRTDDERASRNGERKSLSAPGTAQRPSGGSGKAVEPTPEAMGSMYATAGLNIRTGPGEEYDVVDTVETGTKLAITSETDGEWSEIVYDDEALWVTTEYLAEEKPAEEPEEEADTTGDSSSDTDDGTDQSSGGLSTAPCAAGSTVESGLTSNAISVHRAVCAEFPEVTAYGGLRPGDGGEHGTGQALDIMITGSTGDAIADFVRANAGALGVSEVLWSQHIWTVQRASEGWRPMEDRGSVTANHYDHVHVTVY